MTKEEIIKNIMLRRGALHVINEHRFYSEASVINCLQEAFGLLPQPYVIGSLPIDRNFEIVKGLLKWIKAQEIEWDDDLDIIFKPNFTDKNFTPKKRQ